MRECRFCLPTLTVRGDKYKLNLELNTAEDLTGPPAVTACTHILVFKHVFKSAHACARTSKRHLESSL